MRDEAPRPHRPAPPAGWREAFETELHALAERTEAPGLAVTLFVGDDVLLEAGYGWRDVEAQLPVTADTLFGIASITKSFTALSLQILASDGLLSLDDPITDYFPFTLWRGGPPARLRHFLDQTSGLPPTPTMTWLRAASQADDPVTAQATLDEALTTVAGGAEELERRAQEVSTFQGLAAWLDAHVQLVGQPGQQFSYSNDGFCLMGGVVEQVTGEGFGRFVQGRILEPLGMNRSTFELARVLADANHAQIYERGGDGRVLPSPKWQTTGRMLGGGMLKSTLADLRAWVRFLMQPEGQVAGRVGVDPKLVREMAAGATWSGPGSRYGLGLRRHDAYAGRLTIIGHGGGLKGVSSQIAWVPELGVGVVVLSNLGGLPSEKIATMALNAYAGLPVTQAVYHPPAYAATQAEVLEVLGAYASGEPYGRLRLYLNEAGQLRALVGEPATDVPAFLAGPSEVALRYAEYLAPVTLLRRPDGAVWAAHQGLRVLTRMRAG
jgi:CubicO group peptidase (beta-lactamase class C family)